MKNPAVTDSTDRITKMKRVIKAVCAPSSKMNIIQCPDGLQLTVDKSDHVFPLSTAL